MEPGNNVTPLFGGPVNAVNEPIPELVAFIERLLARAKAGEIRAIAATYVRGNGRPSEGWHTGNNPDYVFVLHSGITCMLGNMTNLLNTTDSVMEAQPPPDVTPA